MHVDRELLRPGFGPTWVSFLGCTHLLWYFTVCGVLCHCIRGAFLVAPRGHDDVLATIRVVLPFGLADTGRFWKHGFVVAFGAYMVDACRGIFGDFGIIGLLATRWSIN